MSQLQSRILEQAEDKIESQLRPGVHDSYMRILAAGMDLALDKGPEGVTAFIESSAAPLWDIVQGAISIIGTLRDAPPGAMPVTAMVPAGFTLMLRGLDFAERAGVLRVTAHVLDQATQLYMNAAMHAMGITPAQVRNAAVKVHGVISDPAKMAHLESVAMQGAPAGA